MLFFFIVRFSDIFVSQLNSINPLGPRPAAALSLRNPMRREVTVPNDPSIQLFSLKNKSIFFYFNPKSEMSASECQLSGWVANFQFPVWISKDEAPWVCQGVQGKRLSHICSSNLKGWRSDAIADSRAFVYFCASVMCPSCNFENSQRLQWTSNKGCRWK